MIWSRYLINVLGPFVLTHVLERHLAGDARVIFANSFMHLFGNLTDERASCRSNQSPLRGVLTELREWTPVRYLEFYVFWPLVMTLILLVDDFLPGFLHRHVHSEQSPTYSQTKQMQLAMVKMLAYRWKDTDLGVYAYNVGLPKAWFRQIRHKRPTSLLHEPAWSILIAWASRFGRDTENSIATGFWLASKFRYGKERVNGSYWDRKEARVTPIDTDRVSDQMLKKLWRTWEAEGEVRWEKQSLVGKK